ncbi:MAG: hypothetical protein MRJ68_17680 [Nitrospira sp.]|nr:hypothetical protein [Nitrospira sp.]
MILQVLSDVTINGPFGFLMYGPGELIDLPVHQAVRIVDLEPTHFKIVKPIPLLAGVEVRWLLSNDRPQGPGIVELVAGERPNRNVAVMCSGALRWVEERDLIEIDVWPLINKKQEEAVDYAIRDGLDSPRLREIQEWLMTHFGDD